ncbi:ankyrin repeat-containing domain protein [Pyronema omphalodes]|nr:ankyrin repeat-containing domain protein [Pyronema omphalodes]
MQPTDTKKLSHLPPDLVYCITADFPPQTIFNLVLTSRQLAQTLLPVYYRQSASYPAAVLQAASKSSPYLLENLLYYGASPDTTDAYGFSCLDIASRLGHNHIITTLLNYGAYLHVCKGGRQPYSLFSPLDYAAKHGHVETFSLLLSHLFARYPEEEVNEAVGRALQHAVQERRAGVISWLLTYVPPSQAHLQQALNKVVNSNLPSIAQLLLSAGADPNTLAPDQPTTLIHRAAERNRVELVELLIEAGAEIDMKDGVGLAPLHYAVKGNAVDAMELLLEAGADIDQTSTFGTAFSGAIRKNWSIGVEVLAAWGIAQGWDVKERWQMLKRQRKGKAVEEAFLRAVGAALGEEKVNECLDSESETVLSREFQGAHIQTNQFLSPLQQSTKSPVNPSRLCRIFTGDG